MTCPLSVADGEFMVLGRSSAVATKTTALRMVAGLEEITDERSPLAAR